MSVIGAMKCFDENRNLFGNAQTEAEKFNLYQGLSALAEGVLQLQQQIAALQQQVARLEAQLKVTWSARSLDRP